LVESTTPTEIKCRTLPKDDGVKESKQLVVFLRTFEEAKCLEAGNCMFTWTDDAMISSYSADFDVALNDYVLTLTGSNFGATPSNTEVYIDDVKQQIISASNTEIKVKIIDMLSSTSSNIDIYLPSGTPDDSNTNMITQGFTLTPRLHSVTP